MEGDEGSMEPCEPPEGKQVEGKDAGIYQSVVYGAEESRELLLGILRVLILTCLFFSRRDW